MKSESLRSSHPYYHVHGLSRFFLGWISPLIKKRSQQGTLHLNDLYDLLPELESAKLTEDLETEWLHEVKQKNHKPSLIRATLRAFGWRPLLVGLLLIPTVI